MDIIHRDDLAETAAFAEHIANLHCNVGFNIPLTRARNALRGQQRMTDNEAGLHLFVMVVVAAMVIV